VLDDRYVLEAEIGRGGMATVYRALDRKHDRPVAVKILSPDLSPLLGVDRFAREIRLASSLQHPHIVPLYDSGDDHGALYYVMPLVEGETLRERLDRETHLPLPDAVRIALDVLEALSHAHAHGVIHRDIKPENILLTADKAVVTDFGIAKAIGMAGGERVTSSGLAVGTPFYMSPEQASAQAAVDGRADLYAVACVLYEMAGGEPPFTGPTPHAVLARQLLESPRSLRIMRPTVPMAFEQTVARGLAKVPADRFQTAATFADALRSSLTLPDIPVRRSRAARSARIGGGLLVAALAVYGLALAARWDGGLFGGRGAEGDTTMLVVLPVARLDSVTPPFDEGQLLRDAIGHWRGISLADPAVLAAALRRHDPRDPRGASRLATSLGAGRSVRVEVSQVGDSLRVHAALFDVHDNRQLADSTVRIGHDVHGADMAFAALADRLLLRRTSSSLLTDADDVTHVLPAAQSFHRGIGAIEQWDLASADSAFADAAEWDPAFPQALAWLAVTRWWQDDSPAAWRSAAARAAARLDELAPLEAGLVTALQALANDRTTRACEGLGRLTAREPNAFAAWYAWATCLRRDLIVVRDARSPSGWRFRSSYNQALKAYMRAFVLLPSIHRSLRRDPDMRRVLLTNARQVLRGRAAPPDSASFGAHPAWQGDSLVLYPYPSHDFDAGRPWTVPATRDLAIRHEQQMFRDVATAWSVAAPDSPDAIEALAVSLEQLGDPASLDTLQRARRLAAGTPDEVRLAAHEVWLRLKFAAPSSADGVRAAGQLADSLLAANPPSRATEPLQMAGLAALTGRADLAAAYSRSVQAAAWLGASAQLVQYAPLLVFAAFGGPPDSLTRSAAEVERAIVAGALDPDSRALDWVRRAATLAYPGARMAALTRLERSGDYLAQAEMAFDRHDTAGVRSVLQRVRAARRSSSPAVLSVDNLYTEAWLLDAIGDPAAAAAWLDPTLSALAYTPPETFADPIRAASLVRAMALRADAGARTGDTAAARPWASVVATLWSDADAFLQPLVERMRQLER